MFTISDFNNRIFKISLLVLFIPFSRKITKILLKNIEKKLKKNQRQKTFINLLSNSSVVIINFTVVLLILSEIGLNIGPVLAGAGILGLAVSMGAKDVASDLIAGIFILIEDQFNIGDYIKTKFVEGKVIKITFRTITLKNKEGHIHIVPNSELKTITKIK